jgi:uncharacterized protein (TIGR02246 family)
MNRQTATLADISLLAASFLATGCMCNKTPAIDKAAIETKIRQLDTDWVKAAATHSADAWDAFYADDAVVLPPNDKTITDKASIKAYFAVLMGMPGLNLTWTDDKVVVADAGDMAYTYGTYTLNATMGGKPMNDKGKNLEIWRKQADGSWKCTADMWSSDMPMPGM